MLARDALETIRKRLETVRVSHKALEALLKLQPVLEAIEPTKAERLDICISLATLEGEWMHLSSSRVKQDRAETEELLEPYRVRLAAIATSPVIHYGSLKSLLGEVATAVRGIQATPDLEIGLYQTFEETAIADIENKTEAQWLAEIEQQATLEP